MLDCKDFEVLAIVLEDIAPLPERSVELLFTNNNTTGLTFLANVLIDLEFARLLQEASD